jgi:hypothetical protein
MNRDDIMRMAKNEYGIYAFTAESLAHFAALVAANEREACAKLCEEMARRHDDIRRAALEVVAEWIRARGET